MRKAVVIFTLALLATVPFYFYGRWYLDGYIRQRDQNKADMSIASCIGSYTGEDESQWAWSAYIDTSTDQIVKSTHLGDRSPHPEAVVDDCLSRRNQ